jgi:hypothetical protein
MVATRLPLSPWRHNVNPDNAAAGGGKLATGAAAG